MITLSASKVSEGILLIRWVVDSTPILSPSGVRLYRGSLTVDNVRITDIVFDIGSWETRIKTNTNINHIICVPEV